MYKKVTQWVERNSEGEQSLDPTFFTEKMLPKAYESGILLEFFKFQFKKAGDFA